MHRHSPLSELRAERAGDFSQLPVGDCQKRIQTRPGRRSAETQPDGSRLGLGSAQDIGWVGSFVCSSISCDGLVWHFVSFPVQYVMCGAMGMGHDGQTEYHRASRCGARAREDGMNWDSVEWGMRERMQCGRCGVAQWQWIACMHAGK